MPSSCVIKSNKTSSILAHVCVPATFDKYIKYICRFLLISRHNAQKAGCSKFHNVLVMSDSRISRSQMICGPTQKRQCSSLCLRLLSLLVYKYTETSLSSSSHN